MWLLWLICWKDHWLLSKEPDFRFEIVPFLSLSRCSCRFWGWSLWQRQWSPGSSSLCSLSSSSSSTYVATSCRPPETSNAWSPPVSVRQLNSVCINPLYHVPYAGWALVRFFLFQVKNLTVESICTFWRQRVHVPSLSVPQLGVQSSRTCLRLFRGSGRSEPLELRRGSRKHLMPIRTCTQVHLSLITFGF